MIITPLRDLVVVTLLPEAPKGRITVVRSAKPAVRRATVIACGPEVRDVEKGQTVLINLLVCSEINGKHLVPEPSILGTL